MPVIMLCAGRRVAWAKLGLNSRDMIEMTCLLLSCHSLAVLFPLSDLSAACLGSCSASPLFSRWAQRWLGAFCRNGCCHTGWLRLLQGAVYEPYATYTLIIYTKYTYTFNIMHMFTMRMMFTAIYTHECVGEKKCIFLL